MLQAEERPLGLDEVGGPAGLDELPGIEHEDAVAVHDRLQSVRDGDDGALREPSPDPADPILDRYTPESISTIIRHP